MQGPFTLGIDLGGTNIKAVLLDAEGNTVEKQSTSTKDDEGTQPWKQGVKAIVEFFQKKTERGVVQVGISAPGLASADNSCIAHLPNKLLGIENFRWGNFLGIKARVLNDAHAALVAESRMGAGVGHKNIILLTLGTGVGGGVIFDGKLLQGRQGRAGHFGHISVSTNRGRSIVGTPGTLENAIGETTVISRTYGRYPSTKALVEGYRKGETFASWVWLRSVQQLSRGIVSLINAFSPDIVIIAGGITKAGDDLFKPLGDFLDIYEWRPGDFKTPVVRAQLTNYAGAVGAGLFVMEPSHNFYTPEEEG
jgi:glucokinase